MQPGLSVRRAQANLKPEAPLSALLPTNNEIERFLGGRASTIKRRGALSTPRIENIIYPRVKDPSLRVPDSVFPICSRRCAILFAETRGILL